MLTHIVSNFLNLLYPPLCLACEVPLVTSEEILCIHCLATLIQTRSSLTQDSIITNRLTDTIPIHRASALFTFLKKGPIQQLIHKIKYRNRTDALKKLGKYLGTLWKETEENQLPDTVIPVPLHKQRLRERGYNQSQFLAEGIAEALAIPCQSHWLIREHYTTSQTNKTKRQRQENVKGAFIVKNPQQITGKHLLLVDDIITTGATLKECAQTLLSAGSGKISVAVLGVAQ